MNNQELLLDQGKMLVDRIERISVDSIWARRSSGYRGDLLKWIEKVDKLNLSQGEQLSPDELVEFSRLIEIGFDFLYASVREKYR
jgi:hypothetical protein